MASHKSTFVQAIQRSLNASRTIEDRMFRVLAEIERQRMPGDEWRWVIQSIGMYPDGHKVLFHWPLTNGRGGAYISIWWRRGASKFEIGHETNLLNPETSEAFRIFTERVGPILENA